MAVLRKKPQTAYVVAVAYQDLYLADDGKKIRM